MSEGKPIGYDELFTAEAWEKFIANLEKAKSLLGDVNGGLTSISKQKIGDLQGGGSGKKSSVDDIKKENDAIAKINATYEAKIKLMKEEGNIDKQILQFKNDLKNADKADADAKKKIAKELENKNKLTREEIQLAKLHEKEQKASLGSYDQLSAKLGIVSIRAKQMSAAHRENSVTGKLVVAEQLRLRNSLIALDEKTNLHVRKVGDYTSTISKLSKGLGGLLRLGAQLGEALGLETEALTEVGKVGRELIKTSIELREARIGQREVSEEITGAEKAMNAEMATANTLQAENATITDTQTASEIAHGEAIAESTVKQKALNVAQSETPWGLAAIGITAVIGGLSLLVESMGNAKTAEEELNRASDGTIIKDKELREEKNKLIIEYHKMGNEIKVAAGAMSELDAAVDNLKFDQIQKFNTEMNEVRKKFIEDEGGTSNLLLRLFTGTDAAQIKYNEGMKKTLLLNKAEFIAKKQELEIEGRISNEKKSQVDTGKLLIAQLENKKAQKDLSGGDTYEIEKQILEQKAINDRQEVALETDAAAKIEIINVELSTSLLELEKKHRDSIDKTKDSVSSEIEVVEDLRTAWEKFNDEQTQNDDERNIESPVSQKEKDLEKFRKQFQLKTKEEQDFTLEEIQNLYDKGTITFLEYQVALTNIEKTESDKRKKVQEDELTQVSEMNKAIGKGLDDRIKSQEDALKIQSSQIDSELSVQTQLFKDGLDNTLDYEQKAKAENTRQQLAAERKAAKEKKGIELANTYISFLQSYLKDGTDAQGAATKALAQTLIAEGIADAIAGTAYEGTEDTGGEGRIDNKGGKLWVLHPHERVVPKDVNEKLGGLSNDELGNLFDNNFANIYSPNMQMQIPNDSIGGRSNADWQMMVDLNMKLADRFEKAVSKIETTKISVDDFGRVVESVNKNGIQKTITHRTNTYR